MYTIKQTRGFRRSVALCQRRGYNMDLLKDAIVTLAMNGVLPASYKPHKLTGNYAGTWECHLRPDWLLLWEQNDDELTLLFTGTGTHSDLFNK